MTEARIVAPAAGDLAALIERALGREFASPGLRGIAIKDIVDDSRRVVPGALFVAVPGTKANGAQFARQAVERGAVAVVCEEPLPADRGCPIVRVPDARSALARLAAIHYGLADIQSSGRLSVVGITGTNGKSTIAFMVRGLLRAAGRSAALFGTIEYDLVARKLPSSLTTPDAITLARHLVEAHRAGARYAVLEASSHSLEQRRTDGLHFSAAVFTNLTQDHLDYHKTFDDYLLAKRRLFDSLAPDAAAIVNVHDAASSRMTANCGARIVNYGFDVGADVRGVIVSEDASGSRFLVRHRGDEIEVQTPLVGRHNVLNALAAASVGITLGLDLPTIRRGLAETNYVPGRLQSVSGAEIGFNVFVDYAHTDDALRNVLRALRPLTHRRLWCVFGCGGDRDKTKRPLMARAVAEGADAFVITSDNPRTEDPLAIIADIEVGLLPADRPRGTTIPARAAAIGHAIERLEKGDTLVIAGKGHEDYQILGTEKIHFDDVEVAQSALQVRLACNR